MHGAQSVLCLSSGLNREFSHVPIFSEPFTCTSDLAHCTFSVQAGRIRAWWTNDSAFLRKAVSFLRAQTMSNEFLSSSEHPAQGFEFSM